MRHAKHTFKIGRTGSHRRCMIANMLKSLIWHERIETTPVKAKEVKRYADKMVTLAKANTLTAKRRAASIMHIRYNPLTSKEKRDLKNEKGDARNLDRKVLTKLFGSFGDKYKDRQGGYTRVIRKGQRVGDAAPTCYLEWV